MGLIAWPEAGEWNLPDLSFRKSVLATGWRKVHGGLNLDDVLSSSIRDGTGQT